MAMGELRARGREGSGSARACDGREREQRRDAQVEDGREDSCTMRRKREGEEASALTLPDRRTDPSSEGEDAPWMTEMIKPRWMTNWASLALRLYELRPCQTRSLVR